MRGWIRWAVGASALTLFACLGAVATPPTDAELQCPTGERAFNGACRKTCVSTSQCSSSVDRCMHIDAESVCVPYQQCAYLASDTQCVGTGTYTIYTRGGQSTRPYVSTPYDANPSDVTGYADPYFVPYYSGFAYGSPEGCAGNARWVTVPAEGDPGCAASHEVRRCRRRGNVCVLENGSTRDFVSP